MVLALGWIDDNQDNINETTYQAIKQLLYYCTTRTYATISYKESYMVICVHRDGSYL